MNYKNRKKRNNNEEAPKVQPSSNNGSWGYSPDALAALESGQYGKLTGRKAKYNTSAEQTQQARELPVLAGMVSATPTMSTEKKFGKNDTTIIDPVRARQKYADRNAEQPSYNDENYVVKRDRYNKLMQDSRLANDIKLLAEINYKNANQDATVSQEWADEYGAKAITGGLNKSQFLTQLSKRYELTPEELNDMALTFHSDAYNAENEAYGKQLEQFGQDHSVLGSAGSFVGTLGSGIEGMYNNVVGGITGDDRYLSNIFKTTKNSPREGVKKNIDSNIGKGAYDIGMGIGDMFVGSAAGSAPVILAGNTANEAQRSAMERGSGVRKSSLYGTGAGVLDFITNKIGLDKAKQLAVSSVKDAGIKGLKGFLAKNTLAGLGEAGENIIQDVGQSFLDVIINGKNAELLKSFDDKVASGMSEKDAFVETAKEYAAQIGMSAATGFGMGSAMQAGSSAMPKIPELIDRFQYKKTPNQDIQNIVDGKVPEVTSEADVQKAAQAQEQAAAEIERLAEQIPEAPVEEANPAEVQENNVQAKSAPNEEGLYPEEVAARALENKYSNLRQYSDQPVMVKKSEIPEDVLANILGENFDNELDSVKLGGELAKRGYNVWENGYNNNIMTDGWSIMQDAVAHHLAKDNIPSAVMAEAYDIVAQRGGTLDEAVRLAAEMAGTTIDEPVPGSMVRIGDGTSAPVEAPTEAPNRTMNESAGSNDVIVRRTEQVPKMQPTPEPETAEVPKVEQEIKPLEGEELAKAKEQVKNIDLRIKELEGKKKFDLENKKNYHAGKLKKAIEKQHKEYNKEIAALKKQKTAINRQIKGKAEPISEKMKRENRSLYESIFGGPGKGAQDNVYNKINAAVQMAGDTPEAKELANGMKKAIRDFINTGDFEHIRKALEFSIELDKKAREGGRLYYTSKHSYEYKDVFNRIDENGNEVESDLFNSIEPYVDNLRQYIYDINGKGTEAPTSEAPAEPVQPINGGNNVPPDNGGNNVPPEGNVPPSQPPRTDVMEQSDVGQNTAVNSGVYTREQLDNDPIIHELNSYAKANNDLTYNQAKEDVISDGATLLDEYSSGKRAIANDIDVDRSMILLTDLTRRIEAGETGLEAQKNLLFSRLRQAGTKYGQTIQAFAKWNQTPEGAIINAERIHKAPVEKWKENNQTKTQANSRIAKALERMGYDGSMEKTREPLTRDQIREGVIKAIEQEYGSIEGIFNDEDIEFLTDLAQNKKIPIWQITDEIEHRLNHGVWYEITEDTPEPAQKGNQKLQNALNSLLEREPEAEKAPLSFDELKKQIRATLDKEAASAGISRLYTDEGGFTDADVDYLAHMIQNGATRAELAEALDTKLATGTFGISADTQAKVNRLFEYAAQFDPNSKEAVEAMSAAYKLLADEVVGEFAPFEKFEAWRYLAMLGNPKTMLRNYIGNKIFGAVTGVSNNFSALLEAGTDKLVRKITKGQKGIQRTKAILNPVNDRGLIKAASTDADAHRYKQIQGSKYEKGVKDAIRSEKSVFNSRWAQIYESLTDRGISDYSAVKEKYSTSLAGWMKANGLDESAFDADNRYRQLQKDSQFRVLTDAEKAQMESYKQVADKLEKARDYALKQAEYATFHEDNVVAKKLTKWSMDARNSDSGLIRAMGYMGEGLVPFKKTPANVLRSGVEYSPINVINSIRQTGKFIIENTGHRKNDWAETYTKRNKLTGREKTVNRSLAADVLDSWSKTLTGTALAGLGYYLFNKGILHSSDDGEKYQDQLEGKQNYSIIINGKSYTIDWASPAAMPLLMGAELSKIWQKAGQEDAKFYDNIEEIVKAVGSLFDPVFETSMLQGIQNTAESVAHEITYGNSAASKGLGIAGAIAGNTITNYLTQGIPTILGQVARTVDPTRRTTDTASDGFMGSVERVARKQMNKIPGLSMLNQPYMDAYARTQNNSPFNNPVGNLAYQMLSPGYLADVNETAADTSARAAFNGLDAEGKPIKDENVFPTWKSTVKINGEKLTPEQMAVYRETSGKAQYEIRSALANEDWFNALSATQQTDILKKVNTVIDKVGKAPFAEQTGTEYEKYAEGGLPSLLDYFRSGTIKTQVEQQTGLTGTTNANKAIVEQIEQGNEEAANQMIDAATAITNAGLTKPGPTATYYAAQEVDPDLTPDDFIMLYKDIDGADGSAPNQGIKVPEIIAYLNSTNYTKDEGVQIWRMFKPANAKKVPELKKQDNGTYIWE